MDSVTSQESEFISRHIGPQGIDVASMLEEVGYKDLESFIQAAVPETIRLKQPLQLRAFPKALSEFEALQKIRSLALQNEVWRSFIGLGYSRCIVPPVIQRTILENPSWYTHYTPYQPEISQGRLEALLNYQTMICDLTGLDIANASMLDEGTAAAEAMGLSYAMYRSKKSEGTAIYLVAASCHPQTIEVVKTRAEALGITIEVAEPKNFKFNDEIFGALVQYPNTHGVLEDYSFVTQAAHKAGALVTFATDLLALTLAKAPSEFGADIAVGSSQRFGVPLGFGGPHAAFFATRDQYKRIMPGRLVGVSKDAHNNFALRLSLQTREQHIRREKATSNICTAQVLLAVMAGMYAVYHGPYGLQKIAHEVRRKALVLTDALRSLGVKVRDGIFFDTITCEVGKSAVTEIQSRATAMKINLRYGESFVAISLDEQTSANDLSDLIQIISGKNVSGKNDSAIPASVKYSSFGPTFERRGAILSHEVFNNFHSETEFLRYVKRLESKDLSLATSMIPLGSCTMKLNAASEMYPVSWKEFGEMHPFAPPTQSKGYTQLFDDLERALADITGFPAVSLQPNAGSQGELAGLLVIRAYHQARGDSARTLCLIPKSAHGTNPASATMAGFEVVVVNCDAEGNVDIADLKNKAVEHSAKLAALMVTYPSTHGVFEEQIRDICRIVHDAGGQVYMDGANLNAHVGLTSPASIGADVCHINLHKTFCIPHGGGGPGMGPICVAAHLSSFLPSHPLVDLGHSSGIGPISAAPWGSASILPIPWMYIAMMGAAGLTRATQIAILNANYVATRLGNDYPVLYRGKQGLVAHECIIDLRPLKKSAGIEAEDIAKRLMDYGFHAPTLSFPVPGTLMIEPTESESKVELDRFCEAMIAIRQEVRAIEEGRSDPQNNPLKHAPHTALAVCSEKWDHPYSREQAAFPSEWSREFKFWPMVGRIDGTYGDRNLICTCPPMEDY